MLAAGVRMSGENGRLDPQSNPKRRAKPTVYHPWILAQNSNHERWKIEPIGEVCSSTSFDPAKPADNAFIESYNDRLRDECLNVHRFT
jgi:hypothetical protein